MTDRVNQRLMYGEIDRRTMLATSMLAAAGVALCGCGLGEDPTAPSSVAQMTINVSDFSQLANVGGVALVNSSAGSPLAVVRTGTATFVTLSRICPHQGATVNVETGGFLCPRHGAEFSSDGTHIGGQATTNLHSYPTSFDVTTGTITIG